MLKMMSAGRQMPCARALYSFDGQGEHELTFSAGMSLLLLRRVDENWLEGELGGKIGIFPASHVHIELGCPSLAHENDLAGSGKPYAIALYTFSGEEEGDLGFSKGELLELVDSVASGWLRGRIGDREGIFPSSFVEILKPSEVRVREEEERESDQPVPKPRRGRLNNSYYPVLTNGSASAAGEVPPPTPSRSAPAPPYVGDSDQV